MARDISRRDAVKHLAVSSAGMMFAGVIRGHATDIIVAGQAVEVAVWSVSAATVRITVRPLQNGNAVPVPVTGALVQEEFGNLRVRTRNAASASRVRAGDVVVSFTEGPPTIHVHTVAGALVIAVMLLRLAIASEPAV